MVASTMSPLTMALLSGGMGGAAGGMYSPYGAMAMYDPHSAAALQQLQLGRGMMASGLDSSAAFPMQALSRLAQTIAGITVTNRAMDQLGQAPAQQGPNIGAFQDWLNGSPSPAAVPSPQSSAVPAPTDSTAFAANNPLNIRYANQPGAVNTNGFAAFPTAQAGQDATNKQFGLYADRGVNTLRGLISTWAPPNENDTNGYIARVSKETGLDPDATIDLRNPQTQALIQHSMAGVEGNKNATAPGTKYAQAGNVATDATPTLGPSGESPGAPQTGANNPEVKAILDTENRAAQALAAHPFPLDPYHIAAQNALDVAKQKLTMGVWLPTTIGGIPGQINHVTGEFKPTITGTGRFGVGPHGETLYAAPGGGLPVNMNNNPSGITGNTPEANAARTLIELRDKVQSGQASPDEMARYNLAFTTFQHNTIETNPATKQLGIVPTVPAPVGFPAPGAQQPQPAPAGGTQGAPAPQQGGPQISIPNSANPGFTALTPNARGPEAQQAITTSTATNDLKNVSDEQAKILAGHNVLGTTSTIRAMLPQVTTGTGADQRLAAGKILAAAGINDQDTTKALTGTNVPAGEILQKKLFELTTGAVRGMGAREPGSVMLMFNKNYPQMSSRNMTIDAMTRLIDMDQQWKEDNSAGQRDYLNGQVQGVGENKPYGGLSGYQQPDPRLYQAAALATGGMPYSVWSQGLTPDQQTQALKLGARVYPDASALDAKGVRHVFQGAAGGR